MRRLLIKNSFLYKENKQMKKEKGIKLHLILFFFYTTLSDRGKSLDYRCLSDYFSSVLEKTTFCLLFSNLRE